MGIYARHYRLPVGPLAPDPAGPSPAGNTPLRDQEMVRRRRLAPIDEPLPATFQWVARLPRNVQPLALLRRYPRVVNMLAGAWRDPKAFRAYLDELLIDRRGNRQGFAPEIQRELVLLRAHLEETHPAMLDVYKDAAKRA
jgi:hypothetical protein